MTEPVKIPGTEEEAPDTIYIFDFGDDICWCADSCPEPDMKEEDEIKYHRADTVTPNALVEELVAAAKAARVSMTANEHRRRLFDAIAAIEENNAASAVF